MSQALHIFKKDVRHLRFEIAIALTVTALFSFIETKHALWPVDIVNSRTPASYLALLLLPVTWWMLIGRAIHDEALPGDRQFWITRPYSWRSLLSAKMLFILAFINVPMLIAQVVILRAYGFSIVSELPGLLWCQLLVTVVFILPVAAVSALTTGFVQLIAGILTPCVIALAVSVIRPARGIMVTNFPGGLPMLRLGVALGVFTGGYGWVQPYFLYLLIAVAGPAIILWQYQRRGTTVGRCFAGTAVLLFIAGFPWISYSAAFNTQSSLTKARVDLSSVHLVSDLGAKSPHIAFRQGDDYVGVRIPLQIDGLPSGTTARIENVYETIQAPDGTTWKSDGFSWQNPEGPPPQFTVQTGFYAGLYLQHNDVPLKVHGTLYLAVFGNPQTTLIHFAERSVLVPQVGLCSAVESSNRRRDAIVCNSAFRSPSLLISYRFVPPGGAPSSDINPLLGWVQMSYSPFPSDLRISPVSTDSRSSWVSEPWDHALVQTLEPLGHIRMDFEVTDLRIGPRPTPVARELLQLQQRLHDISARDSDYK
jgi:hypothetical protein